jgi:hypothetical protein
MKYAILFIALFSAVFLIHPPQSVRDADDEWTQVSDALMLEVPSCYSNGMIKLGQTPDQVLSAMVIRPEEEVDGSKLFWKWKQHNEISGTDTLITCTFDKSRLIELDAVTISNQSKASKKELLDVVSSDLGCLQEVANVLLQGKNLSYIEEELAVQQEFRILKSENGYTGIRYNLKYNNNEINS